MATVVEFQTNMKNQLFMLLSIKAENKNTKISGLDRYIAATKAGLSKEDIAWVEKLIMESYGEAGK